MIAAALDRLTAAGIPFAPRGEQPLDDPPSGGDVDILVRTCDADAAGRALEAAGFHRVRAAGHAGHRFHLAFDPRSGRWLKIDLNLVPSDWDLTGADERFARYRVRPSRTAAVARRLPLAPRRLGPVIALLGPDGAGKGSVIQRLRAEIPIAVTTVYMGNGAGSARPRRPARAAAARLPAGLRLAQHRTRRALRAAARAWRAHAMAWRGDVVLCDRHPLEALAIEPDGGGLRGALGRLVPWPDEIVVLDAPGEVLFARKGEHSPERLEQWRHAYRDTFAPRGATIVPAAGDIETSVAATSKIVWRGLKARRGW